MGAGAGAGGVAGAAGAGAAAGGGGGGTSTATGGARPERWAASLARSAWTCASRRCFIASRRSAIVSVPASSSLISARASGTPAPTTTAAATAIAASPLEALPSGFRSGPGPGRLGLDDPPG